MVVVRVAMPVLSLLSPVRSFPTRVGSGGGFAHTGYFADGQGLRSKRSSRAERIHRGDPLPMRCCSPTRKGD
jgi:hypothetical protein